MATKPGLKRPPLPTYTGGFQPVAHDTLETQTVWGGLISAPKSLTASVTAGSGVFKIARLNLFDAAVVSVENSGAGDLPAGHGPVRPVIAEEWKFTPVSSSNGAAALVVQAGQYVTLDVTVDVPQDSGVPTGAAGPSLPPGRFTGTAVIQGDGFSQTVALSCSFLAVALGSPIGQKWLALGGEPKVGVVKDLPHTAPDGKGTIQTFANGVLYQLPVTSGPAVQPQVYFLSTQIYAKWVALGSATDATGAPVWNSLGYPAGDTYSTPESGQALKFQGGAIVVRANKQAWAVYGAIYKHYQAFGDLSDPNHQPWIGLPRSDEGPVDPLDPGAGQRVSHFDGGDIYWSGATGAWEMHGAILQHWLQAGGFRPGMGLPTTDETTAPDGVGRYNQFQGGGAIYWNPAVGASVLVGPILDHWKAIGGVISYLGYPTSDVGPCTPPLLALLETMAPEVTSGVACSFQFGQLLATPDGRVFELPATVTLTASGSAGADTGHLAYSGTITLKSDGEFEVAFRVEDDAGLGYDYQIAATAKTSSGIWLGAVRSGSVAGSLDTGGSKTESPTVSGKHPWIAQYWKQIQGGLTLKVTLDYSVNGVAGFLIDEAKALVAGLLGATVGGPVLGAMILLGEEVSQMGLGVSGTIGVIAGVAAFVTTGCILLAIPAGIVAGAVAAADISKREISNDEYNFANNVFHGTLPPISQLYLTNLSGLNGRCFTAPGIDGNIYLNVGDAYNDPVDFSLGPYSEAWYPRKGELFIHELTHAWQIHHNSFVPGFVCDAVFTQLKYMTGVNVYAYGPPTTPWGNLSIEAQGALVDKWFGGVPNPSSVPVGQSYTPNRVFTDKEDPSSPDFAGGTTDPYFHYIRDNIRAGNP